jgi:hypothetical protein
MVRDKIVGDKGQVSIDNKVYYYKRNDAYVEILAERIADFFNLHHVEYIPITHNNLKYYLSEDLNSKGQFNTAYDLGIETYNFNEILEFIKKRYNDDSIIEDLYKMFFMDLMILNIDRNNDNYGFLTKDGKTTLYVLDHGCCFIDNSCLLTCIPDKPDNSSLLEIDNIFRSFDNEHIDMFINMYKSLDVETFKELISQTEKIIKKELPYKKYYISRYESLRERAFIRNKILRRKKE